MDSINQSLSISHIDFRIAHILNTYRSKALVTTSFGTTSAILLHILSRVNPEHPIHFIDTGFLFKETHEYKEELIERYDLNVVTHRSEQKKIDLAKEHKMWEVNPDLCCSYNKVEPLEKVKPNHLVWVSGLIGYQNSFRNGLDIFQERSDIYRYNPLIDWTKAMVEEYFDSFHLPRHPLEREGFKSMGCIHCTEKGSDREGRWIGTSKTECGLHL